MKMKQRQKQARGFKHLAKSFENEVPSFEIWVSWLAKVGYATLWPAWDYL